MKKNKFCHKLFERLCAENIVYGVLRNYASLPYHTAGSDLDIWVQKEHVVLFFEIVKDVAFVNSSHLVSFLSDKRCPKLCYLNTEEGFQMDVFIGDIPYQNNVMIPEKDIVRHIVDYNGINVIDDDYADLIAYLKEIVNTEGCEEKYVLPLQTKKDIYRKTYLKENLSLFSDGFIDLFCDSLQNNNLITNAKKLSREAKKTLSKHFLFFHKIKKIVRFFHSPGYMIVIEGTDGAGKSTIIKAITPILNEAFHKGVIYNHLRPNAIPDLGVLLGKKEKQEANVVNTDPHALKPSGLLGSLVRWGYYMIDYTLGYMKNVWPIIHTKSKVFIFDRYYYDYYIDQKRSRTSLPQWIIRFGEIFVPKPDLILCLGGTPQKIYERKPETSLEEVTHQTEALKKFCDKRENAVWVDTTLPVEESVNITMKDIVEMMAKRFCNTLIK